MQGLGGHDDINVEPLNRLPLGLQYEVLSTGRELCVRDADALADFTEYVTKRYLDWRVDEETIWRDYWESLREAYPNGE